MHVVPEAPLNICAKFVSSEREIKRCFSDGVYVCVRFLLKLIEAEGSACPLMRGTDLRNKERWSMIEGGRWEMKRTDRQKEWWRKWDVYDAID